MSYLERNSQFVSELRNVRLQRGKRRGEGNFITFVSAGSFLSETAREEVFIGLKELKTNGYIPKTDLNRRMHGEATVDRFVHELAIMTVVAQNMPHLLPELPLFYGLVTDENGIPIAIVTEDFSKDGKNRVNKTNLSPRGLKGIFVEGTINEEFLQDAAFIVHEIEEMKLDFTPDELPPIESARRGPIRRLGDFYPIVIYSGRAEHRARFPEEQIEAEIERHSLRIDYEL